MSLEYQLLMVEYKPILRENEMYDSDKPYIQVFEIFNQYLTRVTRDMNYYGDFFRSRVISLIPNGKNTTLVGVEMEGSYPYITNKWEKFFV